MLHLLSVITAAAILAAGIGLVGADSVQVEPTTTDGVSRPTAQTPDIPPGFEGRSVEEEDAPIPEEEEEDVIILTPEE